MKYCPLLGLLLFFSCMTNKDMVNNHASVSDKDQIILNPDYEGEMIPAMQLDKLAEAQFKTVDPSSRMVIEPSLLNLEYQGEDIPAIHLEQLQTKNFETIYFPVPGELASPSKIMPYDGEEIPAIHLDNSTFMKIKKTESLLVVPKVKEDR